MFGKKKSTKPIIIGVCGRSCSGKSRVARKLAEINPDTLHINTDVFFKKHLPKELVGNEEWESPLATRFDRVIYSVKKLKNGEPTHIPSKGWTENFDKLVKPKKIIIIEGYLIFTQPELVKLFDKKIFIGVTDVNILYRRVKREDTSRYIDKIFHKVIKFSKNYENIQKEAADIIIDGNNSKEKVLSDVMDCVKVYFDK